MQAYDEIGISLSKPHLRSNMESDMQKVGEGKLSKDVFLRNTIAEMQSVFNAVDAKKEQFSSVFSHSLRQ